ncbi:MAG: hypothetical protein K6A42_09465 [Treponema sp.]|nr:hypothetical protein [Treponema sp.]
MKARAFFLLIAGLFFSAAAEPFSVRFESDSRLDRNIFSSPQIEADDFARAALLASGASQEQSDFCMEKFSSLWKELEPRLENSSSDEEKADKILFFIYEKLLSKYNFYQTRIDVALQDGVYNCVSSLIIFMHFCKKAGILVCAEECPRHAFCAIFFDGKKIDVETTNPYGVNPGKRRGEDLGNGKSRYITVPAKDYAGRRQVDDRRVIAMVYNNRIVQLQKQKKNGQTIGLALDAYEVQGRSDYARESLELCVLNAASDLSSQKNDQEAIELLQAAQEKFGESQRLQKRIQDCRHNLVLYKIQGFSFLEGQAALESQKEGLRPQDYQELKEYLYLFNGQKASKKNDWEGALQTIQEGLEELPQSKKLLSHKNILLQNLAIDCHNAAADLFNAGKKEEALEKIQEGLKKFPGNKILLSDLKKIQAAMGSN